MNAITVGLALIAVVIATYLWSTKRAHEKERERRALRDAVHDLPGWQPQILIMHVEDRYNYLEIAAKLEMPAQFVLAELANAYATLRIRTLEQEPGHRAVLHRMRALIFYKLMGG